MIYYNYIWFEYSRPYPISVQYGNGFEVNEIWDEKDHNINDLKRKGIYFKGFFNHDGNICRWENIKEMEEELYEEYGFSTKFPKLIYKNCDKIKLIKL